MCSEQPHTVVTGLYRGDVVWYTSDTDGTVQRALVLGFEPESATLRVRFARTRKLGWLHGQPGQTYWLSLRQVSP